MGRSEEQKKDLKLKLTILFFMVLIGGTIAFLGPGLPRVLAHVKKNKNDASSPSRMYYIAKLMDMTWREDEAKEVYEDYWRFYGDDFEDLGAENDWDAVALESKYDVAGGEDYYLPWILRDSDEERPKPVRTGKKEKEILGKVMMAHAKYYWDKRAYLKADHLYACLAANWPEGSAPNKAGQDGIKRKKSRSY